MYSNVLVSIASLFNEERGKLLIKLLDKLLKQTLKPDKIVVFLDGYKSIPEGFPKNEAIKYILYPEVSSAAISFNAVELFPCDYFVSLDDDIIIPNDYLETCVKHMKNFNDDVAISFHGRYWSDRNNTTYNNAILIDLESGLEDYKQLDVMGSGIAIFKPEHLKGCMEDLFLLDPLYRDLLVSFHLNKKNIKIVSPPRKRRYVRTHYPQVICSSKKPMKERTKNLQKLKEIGFMK